LVAAAASAATLPGRLPAPAGLLAVARTAINRTSPPHQPLALHRNAVTRHG